MKKTTRFREMLNSGKLEFLMEAHSGLSAKIAAEAGFQGIWGSGLSISAAAGVRDNNELSWTQVLGVVEQMCDAVDVPMLLDGDTGYGNFNNMRRLVQKLEQVGCAAVCIEDKIFPKTNSFLREGQQPLADMEEFCGKIKAGKDSQRDPDFCIIARVEALIAGWGMEEALKRAEAYRLAGADAILIHSKISKADEVLEFARLWNNRCPLVIVPTKYYNTPTEVFRNAGFSICIWANHLMRTSITAMQETAKQIFTNETLVGVEERVAPLKEVFRLQNDKELEEAESKYLTEKAEKNNGVKVIFLGASKGFSLEEGKDAIPKAMLPVNSKPLIEHSIDPFETLGAKDFTLVAGYGFNQIHTSKNLKVCHNIDYSNTGELGSLIRGLGSTSIIENSLVMFNGFQKYMESLKDDDTVIVSYADIVLDLYTAQKLLDTPGDIVALVDYTQIMGPERKRDLVRCTEDYSFFSKETPRLMSVEADCQGMNCISITQGEWCGVLKFTKKGMEMLQASLSGKDLNVLMKLNMTSLMNQLKDSVNVCYVNGGWMDIDNSMDLLKITSKTK